MVPLLFPLHRLYLGTDYRELKAVRRKGLQLYNIHTDFYKNLSISVYDIDVCM
jgi:hypothetical protein